MVEEENETKENEERVPVKTLDLEGGWIVRSHIDWRRERGTSASVAKTLGLEGSGL